MGLKLEGSCNAEPSPVQNPVVTAKEPYRGPPFPGVGFFVFFEGPRLSDREILPSGDNTSPTNQDPTLTLQNTFKQPASSPDEAGNIPETLNSLNT